MTIRDLGKGITDLVRPDGGGILDYNIPTSISKGVAERVTNLNISKATDVISQGKSSIQTDPTKSTKTKKNFSPIENPLEKFASFSPMWTLAVLTPKQINNPKSYRKSPNDLKHVIFSSGGRFDKQRTVVGDAKYTSPEYFINNFTMRTVMAPTDKTGNSNAVRMEFEIYEPYSMGLLLQSLQASAVNAGYPNYLQSAPFVLRLDFMGYDELGKIYSSVKPKFYVIQLVKTTFQVTESGSVYKCEAVPFNHKGFGDDINTAFTDITLVAGDQGTVEEVLKTSDKSLVKLLNEAEEKLVNEGRIDYPDVYDIQFPEKSSDFISVNEIPGFNRATIDPNEEPKQTIQSAYAPEILQSQIQKVRTSFMTNEIGGATFGFTQGSGGNFVFKKHGDIDLKSGLIQRENMVIDPTKRTFQFAQKQPLTAIINQIILSSLYVKNAIDPKKLTEEGYIKWFRLDVQIELLEWDKKVGDYARKYTYRVVPFYVHHTVVAPPTTLPVGYDQIQKRISKEYNYIYTGKNTDVLKFDIQINNLFYTGVSPAKESSAGTVSNMDQKGMYEQKPEESKVVEGTAIGAPLANTGRPRLRKDPELLDMMVGGAGDAEGTAQKVAKAFHKAFLNAGNGELVKIDLEILGDPYWMADSGIGNYFAPVEDERSQITSDGTVNYESGDTFIYITFRSPVDVNETSGLYDFPAKEGPFSGIFRVLECENQFVDGAFKQKLKCTRMPGQALDYDGEDIKDQKIDPNTALAIQLGGYVPTKTDITDDTFPKALIGNR